MDADKLKEILENHKKWIDKNGGDIANLGEADLRWADLGGADLAEADLRWADLRGADLRGANLGEADLGGADLGGAKLRGADLRGANLRGADLRWADLGGADLGGADLGGAKLPDGCHIYQISGGGSERRMTTYWVETDTVWCGCRTTTLEGFADAVESEYGSGKNPLHYAYYKGAVALFRAMRQEIMGQIPGDGEKRSE